MGSVSRFVELMEWYCATANLGYDQWNRWDFPAVGDATTPGECDCSSLVYHCAVLAGFSLPTSGTRYTGTMKRDFVNAGFKWIADTSTNNWIAGDILYKSGHTAVWTGKYIAEAYGDENNAAHGGANGDQGNETRLSPKRGGWEGYFRYPQQVQPTKSIDEIAQEVIDGKWGNGNARKANLIAAGYDYNSVQKRVNEILNGQATPIPAPEPEPEPTPEPEPEPTEDEKEYPIVIDVSQYQGVIDWEKVKPNIDAAIIRVSQKFNGNYYSKLDTYFEHNCFECERLGIPYGVYLFSNATDTATAIKEAQFALTAVQDKHPVLPIFFDSEDASTASYANACAKQFVAVVKAAGYKTGVYASTSWWLAHLRDLEHAVDMNWIAAWGANDGVPNWNKYPTASQIWQYTSFGNVAGIGGRVDMSLAFVEIPKNVIAKTIDELAHEVLEGKWGNGSARKQALIDAGYDYDAVQARVNELLNEQATVPEPEPEPTPIIIKPADYIVEFGGNGVKHEFAQKEMCYDYEKYDSGKVKMNVSNFFNGGTGAVHSGSYYIERALDFPIKFANAPCVTYSVRASTGWVDIQIFSIDGEKIKFWAYSSGKTIPKFYVDFHFEGMITEE